MKKALIITAILAAAAIVASIFDKSMTSRPPSDLRVGAVILDPAITRAVESIEVLGSGDLKVVIEKAEGAVWKIKGDGFPADASKIADLLDQLHSQRIVRKVGDSSDSDASTGLDAPTRLTLGSPAASHTIELGNPRKTGGQFVRLSGSDASYLTDGLIQAYPDGEAWELKTLVDLDPSKVKSVVLAGVGEGVAAGQGSVVLERESAEKDLALRGLAEGEETNAEAAKGVAGLLKGFTFTKRITSEHPVAADALKKPIVATLETFDGFKYTVQAGKAGEGSKEQWYVKVDANAPTGQDGKLSVFRAMVGDWSFEIPPYLGRKFAKKREAFLRPKQQAALPSAKPQ